MNLTLPSPFNLALAIVISWSLFAILCSLLQEALVLIKAERGRFLKKYLLQQLFDQPNGINWALLLYNHGPIDLLSRAPNKPTSWISGDLFARSLIEIVGNSFVVQSNKSSVASPYRNTLLANFNQACRVLRPSDLQSLFQQSFQNALAQSTDKNGSIDESALYTRLSESFETWFNQLMDRVTLWYEKKTRMRLFWVGFIVALLVNVDSLELLRYYRQHPSAQSSLVQFYQDHQSYLHRLVQNQSDTTRSDSLVIVDRNAIQEEKKYIDSLGLIIDQEYLPVGFDKGIFKNIFYSKKKKNLSAADSIDTGKETKPNQTNTPDEINDQQEKYKGLGFTLLKLLGCLVSGFAASFGAPFWFNLLQKVITKKI